MSGFPTFKLFFLFLASLFIVSLKAGPLSAQTKPSTYREQPSDDAETKLLKERVRLATSMIEIRTTMYERGLGDFMSLLTPMSKLMESQIEFRKDPRDRVAILTTHLASAKSIEAVVKAKVENGSESQDRLFHAGYYRATIELRLLQAQKTLPKEKP